jgi:hypothetical protein
MNPPKGFMAFVGVEGSDRERFRSHAGIRLRTETLIYVVIIARMSVLRADSQRG